MDTIIGTGYSLDDLRGATEAYVEKRTKNWRGACWYKPNTTLFLEWDDETLYQVGELLSCPKDEAECVLKLLKGAGAHFVFATRTYEVPEIEDEADDDEEFDEDGWLVGGSNKPKNKSALHSRIGFTGGSRRYLGILSDRGLRRQTQIIFRDGHSSERVFFPAGDIPILPEYAAEMAQRYEKKHLRQVRFLLRLEIYYLVAVCIGKQKETPLE